MAPFLADLLSLPPNVPAVLTHWSSVQSTSTGSPPPPPVRQMAAFSPRPTPHLPPPVPKLPATRARPKFCSPRSLYWRLCAAFPFSVLLCSLGVVCLLFVCCSVVVLVFCRRFAASLLRNGQGRALPGERNNICRRRHRRRLYRSCQLMSDVPVFFRPLLSPLLSFAMSLINLRAPPTLTICLFLSLFLSLSLIPSPRSIPTLSLA